MRQRHRGTFRGRPGQQAGLFLHFPFFMTAFLIFLGIALATALLAFDTIDNLKAMFQPQTVPVRTGE